MVKILEHSGKSAAIEKKLNYVKFSEDLLRDFEEMYFKYFIDKYLKFTSWYKIVSFEDYLNNVKDINNIKEQDINKINEQIEQIKYVKDKLKSSSYKSGYEIIGSNELLDKEKKLKKIKKTKKQKVADVLPVVEEQLNVLRDVINTLKRDDFKRVILAKNVIYDILAKFLKGVSFLHKDASKKDMYEEYKRYFVDSALDYVREDNQNYNYKCFNCGKGIARLKKPASYDLTWINEIGVDMARKTSHFWDFSEDAYVCPICNLVYSCVPAGFTFVRGKGLFVNQNSSINMLIGVNNTVIDHNTSFEELEEQSYYAIAESLTQSGVENIKKEIDNIQVIKLDASNNSRPYTFNMLSKKKLEVIYKHRKLLRRLVKSRIKINDDYLSIYSEVINRLYDNKNQFDLINQLLQLGIKDKINKNWEIKTIIKLNNYYLGGIERKKMIHYHVIDKIRESGLELREAYENKKAENKIAGISYRLLNALRTKDAGKFMDTLINAYMYLNKEIPKEFVDGLKDEDRFQTLGYSFLLGLQGGATEKNVDKGENNANYEKKRGGKS